MDFTEKTLAYYDEKAPEYASRTINVELSALQNEFVSRIGDGGRILDFGCGSGRDSKVFIEQGFEVVSVDGSVEMCKLAEKFIGKHVICSTFQDYEPDGMFDGIWACASLLHLDFSDIEMVMRKLCNHLNEDGTFYVSFKYGTFSGNRDGRYYTDLNEERFQTILNLLPTLTIQRQYITSDIRPGHEEEEWLNIYLIKRTEKAVITEIHNELTESEDGTLVSFPEGKVLHVHSERHDIDFNSALAKLSQYLDIGHVLTHIEKVKEYVVYVPLQYQEQYNTGEYFINKNKTTGVEYPTLMTLSENGQYRFVDNLPIKQKEFIQGNPMQDISMNIYNLAMQRQLAVIADTVQKTYKVVEKIERGQMDNRIALLISGRKQVLYALSLNDKEDRRIALGNARQNLSDAQNQIGLVMKRRIEEFEPLPENAIGRFFREARHPGYLEEKDIEVYEIQDYFQFYLEATRLLAASYVVTDDVGAAEQVFMESINFLKGLSFENLKTIGYGDRKEEAEDMFYSRPVEYLIAEKKQCLEDAKKYDYMQIKATGEEILITRGLKRV